MERQQFSEKIRYAFLYISFAARCRTQSTKFRMHARKLRVLRDTGEDRPWRTNNGSVCKINAVAAGSTAECISKTDEAFRAYNIRRRAIVAANGEFAGRGVMGRGGEEGGGGISTYVSAYASTRRASPATPRFSGAVRARQCLGSHRVCGRVERSIPQDHGRSHTNPPLSHDGRVWRRDSIYLPFPARSPPSPRAIPPAIMPAWMESAFEYEIRIGAALSVDTSPLFELSMESEGPARRGRRERTDASRQWGPAPRRG